MLSHEPPDPSSINVLVNCELTMAARYDDSGSVVSGDWYLDEATAPPTLRLIGALCDFVTREPAPNVELLFGCPGI
jgi:hypothetical protein